MTKYYGRGKCTTRAPYIARALGNQLENQRWIDAARALHASWGPDSVPTDKDREAFLSRMSRPRARRTRAA